MIKRGIFQTIMETKSWIKYIRNHNPWQMFNISPFWAALSRTNVQSPGKKQSWKMHTLSKKALLGYKRTFLENKRAITGNKREFLISGKRIHWLEDKGTYNLTFHICSGHFWMFQTIVYRNTWLGNIIIICSI